jgi:predicted ATPase
MKIDYLVIRSPFKNLEGTRVDFDENHLMTVMIGRNGSGKSNVLEALVSIFRNLDLGEAPPFAYEIRYGLGEGKSARWVTIEADPRADSLGDQYRVAVEPILGKSARVPFSHLARDRAGNAQLLPKYLFAYYSGPSDRLEGYFRRHRTDFYRKLLQNKVDLRGDIRPLFYAKPFHSQFVLLAFFLGKQSTFEREFLKNELGITELDSVHFVMRRPSWARSRDERFWGARGVVRDFLDELFAHALAPVKVTRTEDLSLTGTQVKNEFFHLFLPTAKSLQRFAGNLTPDVFFKMLESTILSEIISEVRVRVRTSSSAVPLSFRELSEGEQQLLTVLGLLKFTGGEDSLFLLDEPDTHLNPAWAVKYLKYLKRFVPNHKTSHLLMVTHHPLTIAELEKGQVQVMKRIDNKTTASAPTESPRVMVINFILRSYMFDLKTTLDEFTNDKLNRRNFLASKEKISRKESMELRILTAELDQLGFNLNTDDPDYADFLSERYHGPSKAVG